MTYFMARSNLVPYAFVWEKGKTMDFSETIVVCDIKVGRFRQVNEFMNLCECQRSKAFIDLGPRSLRFNIFKTFFFSETARSIEAKFHLKPPWLLHGMEEWLLHVMEEWKWVQMVYATWPRCQGGYYQVCSNDLFYSNVKFDPFCFFMGKCLNCRFLTIEACEVEIDTYCQMNEYMMNYDNQGQGHSMMSKITQIQNFQTSLSKNTPGYWGQISYGASMGCWEWKFIQMFRVTWQDGIQAHIWKKPSKISFFGTKRPMTLKPGIQHQVLKYFQIFSNNDLLLILTIFMTVKFVS